MGTIEANRDPPKMAAGMGRGGVGLEKIEKKRGEKKRENNMKIFGKGLPQLRKVT